MRVPDPLVHAPARFDIMLLLNMTAFADFTYLLGETGLSKGNLATHLGKLEEAGYIKVQKTFRGRVPQTRYSITKAGREALRQYEAHLRTLLGRLEAGS